MKGRLLAILLASAATVYGYTYDYVYNYAPPTSVFAANGYPAENSTGSLYGEGIFLFPYGSSSLILIPSFATNPNDYNLASDLDLTGGTAGTYVHFLRASSSTVQIGSGSYVSVEYTPATGQMNINQCVNGVVTQLGSTTVTAAPTYLMPFNSYIFGSTLWVFVNGKLVANETVSLTTGNGGFGGNGMSQGSGFEMIAIGHHDAVVPISIAPRTISTSVLPNEVSFRWQGTTDDTAGLGMYQYLVQRNGTTTLPSIPATSFEGADDTVQPGTTYTYQIGAEDLNGNIAWTPFTVTTPPAQAVDPRRIGVRPSGSYWGGGGEQIDTLSGNLNFSVPLGTMLQRTGAKIPINLTYNAQNWRQDSGVNWQMGYDAGYGFGWKLQIGSLTPYYADWASGVDHYVYTDSTGAEYHLTVNNGGVWSSTEGVYIWFDSNADKLHFPDGSNWTMGCTSAGSEPDAGTMYPTIMEDVNGNQAVATYMLGTRASPYVVNGSSRLVSVGTVQGGYSFTYNTDSPIPHLTTIMGINSWYALTYTTGAALSPPFGDDPNWAGATTTQLASVTTLFAGPYQFTYDSAGAGELLQATLPYGGHIRWTYDTFQYAGQRSLREVSARYLAADSAGATEWAYGISRDDSSNPNPTIHANMTLTDASGVGAKTWTFQLPGSGVPVWQIGTAAQFVQQAAQGGTVLQRDTYNWSQDPAGNPYISSKTTVLNEGTANQQSVLTQQTLDQYGNTTQSVQYPYNNTTTPLRTYNNTYLSGAGYAPYYVFNRLLTTQLVTNGTTIPLLTNSYNTSYLIPSGISLNALGYAIGLDSANAPPVQWRGLPSQGVTPAVTTYYHYWDTGMPYSTQGSDGSSTSYSADAATGYSAPMTINTQSYNVAVGYTSWLGVSQTTGANGEQLAMTYTSAGLPATGVSPYGATTSYSYGTSSGSWYQKKTTTASQATTITTLDGMGHTVRVATLAGSTVQSYVDTVYGPCACSPLGKISKVSQPYAPGQTPVWTVYTYDGMGRTLSVVQPDGASTTTYAYAGNQTTVTDPAGNWKQLTTDALNNLTTVVEPDPNNQPSGTLTTSYTYDWMNHVTQVSMPRGGTTQTRTFVYDNAGRLTSAMNPENGTVLYYYNSDNTLQYKHDAKGQDTVYTYDSAKRVTMVQKYPTGQSHAEDTCQRVVYTYGSNPYDSTFTQANAYGRLGAAQYTICGSGLGAGTFNELYSYTPAGAVADKRVETQRTVYDQYGDILTPALASLDVGYTYNTEGRLSTMSYPTTQIDPNWLWSLCGADWCLYPNNGRAFTLTYGFDNMGRPVSMTDNMDTTTNYQTFANTSDSYWGNIPLYTTTWVQNAQYDYAGRMTSLQYLKSLSDNGTGSVSTSYNTETMGFSAITGQMTSLSFTGGVSGGITYNYSATQNNGQITQAVDTISGETISYQYDALKRLTSASSTPISGSSPTAWTQSFQYDGFGNMTAKVLNGTTGSIPVNAAANQLSNAIYDLNGNMTSGAGATIAYDVSNRMVSAQEVSGGIEYYGYGPDNKQVYRKLPNGNEEFTLYGAQGEKLGVFGLSVGYVYDQYGDQYPHTYTFQPLRSNVYFAGKMIWSDGVPAYQDRLGTNRANGARFMPYGDEITSTSNDREKFGTYTRDSYTGLDYAQNRYFASTYGRFNTADPYQASAGPSDPSSWNRYSYTRGDPVNRVDPQGTCDLQVTGWGFNDGWFAYTSCDASLGSDINPAALAECFAVNTCLANFEDAQGGGGPAPLPKCTPDELVGGVIQADAQRAGLDLGGLLASVQLAGAPCTPGTPECGKNGTYTQTELNLTGNVSNLAGQLSALNGSQFNCNPGSGLMNVFIGTPHNLGPGATTNCRQAGPTNSLQVNVNVTGGVAQLDIDPYNPAALFGLGSIIHGIFQVLPNTINGTDSNYASIAQALNISLNCQP